MDVFEAVRTVLAVRAYDSRKIDAAIVKRIVEAAHLSASSMNKQPWRFIVVQDEATLRQLGTLATTGPYIADAPLAIVVAIERTVFAISDASRAIQSMALTAWEEGVGSNWVGFAGGNGFDEVAKVLDIPDDLDVLAIIPFGYPAASVGRGKKQRKPIGDVVKRERFTQPFE